MGCKIVISSLRLKSCDFYQIVPGTDLYIAGWEMKVFLSVKQQVFSGSSMKKGKGCTVFFVRNITLKRSTILLQVFVSNAWPERGCSALKRVKTRLRSRLSVEMLQTLLAISINDPNVGTPECESLVTSAVDLWESQKKRRKLPRDQARNITAPSSEGVSHLLPAVTSTAAEVAF